MEVNDLNEIANDIAVSRLVQEGYEKELEALLQSIPEYQELQIKLTQTKATKGELNEKLLEAMREAQLKSWKTEQANFSRAVRRSVSIDPNYKKKVENLLKQGEEVEGFELKETEFISIRVNPTK
jgi:hypothetical protein